MNFDERINFIFIKAHRHLDEQLNGRKWVDTPFVHEYLDAIKDLIRRFGQEYDTYLEEREKRKRILSGAKDIPTDAKQSYEAQKLRIQSNRNRAENGLNSEK